MSESDELAAQVERFPEDHELRWRLAKRLYRTGEYKEALKHLVILRGQWKPKINVARYLAATYYRLGRYDQSIVELEDAVEEWPEEIALREQLARVFEVADRKERAILTWKKLLEIKPEHDIARQALARLSFKTPPQLPGFVPGLDDRDLGLDAGTGLICPGCGTLNTGEFDRCWKCSSYLMEKQPVRSSEPSPAQMDKVALWETVALTGIVLLLVVGAWMTIRQLMLNDMVYTALLPLVTVQDVLNEKMLATRLLLGMALLAGWPLAIWTGITLTRAVRVELKTVIVSGVFFGSTVYVAFWPPFFITVFAVPVLIGLSVIPILWLFPATLTQRAVTSFIQALIVACLLIVIIVLREGNEAVAAAPVVLRRSIERDWSPTKGQHLFPPITAPFEVQIRWDSMGAPWLDARAGRVLFIVSGNNANTALTIKLSESGRSVYYGRTTEVTFKFIFEPEVGKTYRFVVDAAAETPLEITVQGLLTPRLES